MKIKIKGREVSGAAEPVAIPKDVWHVYGKRVALRSVSIEVRAGELIGLIGPDGVGKSTLLGILAGAKRVQARLRRSTWRSTPTRREAGS